MHHLSVSCQYGPDSTEFHKYISHHVLELKLFLVIPLIKFLPFFSLFCIDLYVGFGPWKELE